MDNLLDQSFFQWFFLIVSFSLKSLDIISYRLLVSLRDLFVDQTKLGALDGYNYYSTTRISNSELNKYNFKSKTCIFVRPEFVIERCVFCFVLFCFVLFSSVVVEVGDCGHR
ncbi:hypothetical protein PPACK8108_LOCUS19810 [Phakopsora pachyrhizi]|uniref:Uncharacterized protein n=1 Tax=Phakopsora pachyrhizi TaxID=170000 RepID=A0AAV0BGE9_PHAPC|nr:hypothetical protein PPACK8108_LOCUS19810 [Phakopsora pachyrhizi]